MFGTPAPRPLRIAILGWGSLLWDHAPRFDAQHGPWQRGGPELPLEFSRISTRRAGALTLVVDPEHGAPCRVAFAESRRRDPEDAILDLQSREATSRSNIGVVFADGTRLQARDRAVAERIRAWAAASGFDAAVWTDLPANFADHVARPFGVAEALEYLRNLDEDAQAEARRYVERAPEFVVTPLRRALDQGWPEGPLS